jgi:hypothetical protein
LIELAQEEERRREKEERNVKEYEAKIRKSRVYGAKIQHP